MTSKRIALKSSEAKRVLQEFGQKFSAFAAELHSKQIVEEIDVENGKLYILDNKPFAVSTASGLFPSLMNDDVLKTLPSITVDMGAIPHICNGAGIMRPGIKVINGEFEKGAVLLVKDIKFGKSIGICIAEVSSGSMQTMGKGKAAQNVHYVGDSFWQAMKPD
jgi:predicted RNA-binding protein (TIGR00451 family)